MTSCCISPVTDSTTVVDDCGLTYEYDKQKRAVVWLIVLVDIARGHCGPVILPVSGLQNPHNGRLLLFINCLFLRLSTLESVFAKLHVKKATCITREGKLF